MKLNVYYKIARRAGLKYHGQYKIYEAINKGYYIKYHGRRVYVNNCFFEFGGGWSMQRPKKIPEFIHGYIDSYSFYGMLNSAPALYYTLLFDPDFGSGKILLFEAAAPDE